jgi:hypothetical protein
VIVADNGSADATATGADRWIGRIPTASRRRVGTAGRQPCAQRGYSRLEERLLGGLAAMSRAATGCDLVAGYIDMRSLNDPTIRKWTGWEFPTDQLPRGLGFLPFGVGANLGAFPRLSMLRRYSRRLRAHGPLLGRRDPAPPARDQQPRTPRRLATGGCLALGPAIRQCPLPRVVFVTRTPVSLPVAILA